MSAHGIQFIARFSFDIGLIGLDEYLERLKVANWVFDDSDNCPDPREPEIKFRGELTDNNEQASKGDGAPGQEDNSTIEFVLLRKWYFTGSDPDPYPSVPHGHLNSAARAWPKLNPYTGRVYCQKHQEDTSLRLTKNEMKAVWDDPKFRAFCRSHILWYLEQNPYYQFPVVHPLRLPRW